MRYCCVVVLYNPTEKMISNLSQYEEYVEKIYLIDNSDQQLNLELQNKLIYKCNYSFLDGNKGLAYALNIACQSAVNEGFDYIFTMDQDSVFHEGSITYMKEFMNQYPHYGMVVPTISPYFDDGIRNNQSKTKDDDAKFAITSGSLLNLNVYIRVGGFDNSLFIEHIDVDFCIRLYKNGESIRRLGNAILYQRAGNSEPRRILWKEVHPLFASPIRGYYLFRNQKYLKRKYGSEIFDFTGKLYKTIIKTVLFEDKKFFRIGYYIKGYLAGCSGRMGKYNGKMY